jgi:hypothetical protein
MSSSTVDLVEGITRAKMSQLSLTRIAKDIENDLLLYSTLTSI